MPVYYWYGCLLLVFIWDKKTVKNVDENITMPSSIAVCLCFIAKLNIGQSKQLIINFMFVLCIFNGSCYQNREYLVEIFGQYCGCSFHRIVELVSRCIIFKCSMCSLLRWDIYLLRYCTLLPINLYIRLGRR